MTKFGGPNPIGGGQQDPSPEPTPPPWQHQALPTAQPQPTGPPPQGFAVPAYLPQAHGPLQIQPRPRARRGRLSLPLAAALIAVIVVVTGIVVLSGRADPVSAGDTVAGYLQALRRGDAEAALSFATSAPPDTTLLTDDVLKEQIGQSPITDVRIVESTPTGAVHVIANFGDRTVDETLYLEQDGEGGPWKLENAALPVDFQKDSALGGAALIDAVTLFGKPIPPSGRPYVFPGPVDFGTSNPNFSVDILNPTYLLGNLKSGVNVTYTFEITDAGQEAVKQAMLPAVSTCAESEELSPPGCPQDLGAGGMQGTAVWTAPSTLDDVQFTGSIAKDGRQTLMGTIGYSVTLESTDPPSPMTSRPAPTSFYGFADMTKQPPVFTFYTG